MQENRANSPCRGAFCWLGLTFLPVLVVLGYSAYLLIITSARTVYTIVPFISSIVMLANNILLTLFYVRGLSGAVLSTAFQIIIVALGTIPLLIVNIIFSVMLSNEGGSISQFFSMISIIQIVLNLCTGLV